MTQGDIHNRKRTFERLKTRIKEADQISQRDKTLLIKGTSEVPSFLTFLETQDMSNSRINRYLRTWHRLCKHLEWRIEEVTKARITELVGDIHNDELMKRNGKPFAEATKMEMKKGVKKMYSDYVENFSQELEVEDSFDSSQLINFKMTVNRKFTDPERLPTPYIVRKLVENASTARDKAYIMVLWSTGGRNGEVLGLKWRDIDFTNSVGRVKFRDTKTGGDHSVPMAESYPFLLKHRNDDADSSNPDKFVFRSTQSNEQLSSNGAAQIIARAREDADIPQKIKTNPHAFRKGRTSYWARQDKSEAWICKHMNWSQSSRIVRHYCRIAQEDVEKGVAEHLGLEQKGADRTREESKVLTPSKCHECDAVNGYNEDICSQCGETLKSGDLFEEHQIREKSIMFMQEVISSETRFEPEDLDKKAKEFVKDELELD